ncbi:uncharacterized protein LOC62_03G005002 [Vanrija pseudolonga]|uniref:DNA-directed RNA polymerase III subunit RPC9 n=1 Tax=Vanrija pseudolonga TaxID=143232 RepID=A0AAF1BKW0_9TREE|nr:hypothetical protein LOC62_03G005002 [Vanrija pseudolonga]
MKISNNPPQHLSNYEVLQHFLHLKEDNDYLQKAVADNASRQVLRAHAQYPGAKNKFGEAVELPDVEPLDGEQLLAEDDAARRGLPSELVWVQDEVIKYLCADYNVTARQTANGVATLADQLQDYGFTKAELLQACNLAPQSQVGLYLIIEESETRLAQPYDQTINHIVDKVIAPTLLAEPPEELWPYLSSTAHNEIAQNIIDDTAEYDEEAYDNEEEYVHEAEWGPGREGGVDDEEDATME